MAPIEDKTREAILKWFGHVMRRASNAPLKMSERIILSDARGGTGERSSNRI